MGAVLLTVMLILVLNVVPLDSNDIWLQLRIGQMIVDTGSIPRTLLFPFTAVRDNAFTAHEWLPSIFFFVLSKAVGVSNLMFVLGGLSLAQFGLCFLLVRRLCGSASVALFLATVAMIVANYRYVLRPELFALLLLVALLLLLNQFRDGGRRVVLLWTIPIAIVWANSHGSFLLGPTVAAIFALGEGARAAVRPGLRSRLMRGAAAALPYALVALGMVVASMVNPYGWTLLKFAFQVQNSTVIRQMIEEWLPTFHPLTMKEPFFWVFIVVAVGSLGLMAVRWRALVFTDVLLYALFAALALDRSRHIVWFGFVAAAVCARLLRDVRFDSQRERVMEAAGGLFALVVLCCCVSFGNLRHAFVYDAPSDNLTPAMVAELADPKLTGNVFNSYELGAELIYRDWPRLMPSIDSRVDSYGDAYFLNSVKILFDEAGLNMFLSRYGVNHMLLSQRDFFYKIRKMPTIASNWHIRFADGRTYLLERNVPLQVPPLTQLR